MPEFWTFLADLILDLPKDLGAGPLDQITAGGNQFDRCPALRTPANSNNSDVANLSDLAVFFDEEHELDRDLQLH